MVLERLISLRTAVRNPWAMMVVGGIVSIACLVVSFLVFRESVGMFTTFLITMAMTPFMVNLLRYEEATTEEEFAERRNMSILKRHGDMLHVYSAFFIGMIMTMSLAYMVLPGEIVETIFNDQIEEIKIIRGGFLDMSIFERIIVNNISVLLISFLFSFLFGAGAIFILSWNASVLATAIGLAAKALGGMRALPVAVLIFFPHGSLEILAYFIGAIAGGIVSAAVTRDKSRYFWPVIGDSAKFLFVAVVFLVIAGFIETAQL
jgi:uncharacterized membrane protein SpoIIM required for sporulation